MALKGSASPSMIQGETALPAVTYTPGMRLNLRLQVTGTSPTTLRLKVWPATAAEPTGWQLGAVDSTTAMQSAGAVGITAYLSSSATNAPVVVKVSDLSARPAVG
jgi:hypothetical protein